MKRIIAIILAVVLGISAVFMSLTGCSGGFEEFIEFLPEPLEVTAAERTFYNGEAEAAQGREPVVALPVAVNDVLSGHHQRDGYILAPTMVGTAGVDALSRFVLRTPIGYATPFPAISIDGQPQPTVTREDDNTFIIAPAVPLAANSVYVFRLARTDNTDITWAFQTAVRFEITSTLPRHQSANVPVNTGIEIAFSVGDGTDIADYFSIYPHVDGSFIHRDSTVIFAPAAPLAYGKIYRVEIREGIRLPGTDEVTTSGRVFSFETEIEDTDEQTREWPGVQFFNSYVEYPSFAAPSINFWLNRNDRAGRATVDIYVYRIDDRAQAIAAANGIAETPWWSWVPQNDHVIDTSGKTLVYSSSVVPANDDPWMGETFTLSNNLPSGFYVVSASSGGTTGQMILQITDVAVQVIADDDRALLWVNDMNTGSPAAAAQIFDPIGNRTYEVSAYGIAVVEREISAGEYFIVSTANGMERVVFIHSAGFQSFFHRGRGSWDIAPPGSRSFWWPGVGGNTHGASSRFWSVLQLDRTLFQRGDTVFLWGMVQSRRGNENITYVTAVLTEHSWWHSPERDTLIRQNIPATDGMYSGEINLPNIEPGFYELVIYYGDEALNSIFINVMDYVKPPYQLNVSASHAAIFAGEEVTFTATTEFFEGTPVPDLSVSYNLWGWELSVEPDRGSRLTDESGVIEMSKRPTPENNETQGERHLEFSAEATLPEIGWTHESVDVRVFVNDINVNPRASRDGRDAILSVDVHNITLDRINDGTATRWDDFLCEPVAGQNISVEIIEFHWEPVPDGRRYDHVTRQMVTRYRFEERRRSLERFDLATDEDGFATKNFTVPNIENRSYQARLIATDGNGRTITHYVFIGRDFSGFFIDAGDDMPFLYGANPDGYDIGDEVNLTIKRGDEVVTQGNYLFVLVQDGILSYHVGINALSFEFGARHMPNAQVFAYHFNGHTYHSGGRMSQRIVFNPMIRELELEISTCQETYRPGDEVTITITATDLNGNPKAANVNISLVDEALFALMDYQVDTLAMLYGNVPDNLNLSMATHRTFASDGIEGGATLYGSSALRNMADAPAAMAVAENAQAGGGGTAAHIRERFEDTAIFANLRTNDAGYATFTFRLSDNITSWRAAASAVSDDLYAGNSIEIVRVTQPMFLHYTLGSVFLVGDVPYVGANVYGTSLSGGEEVVFEVTSAGETRTATGTAFTRVNIPLWEKTEEGFGEIVIRATVGGYSDAILHTYQVLSSHRLVDVAVFYEVSPGMDFNVNHARFTNITFTDRGRGQFLSDLISLRHIWRSGARVEGLVARREATRLIQTHFPDAPLFGDAGDFDMLEYQTESGGLAILPYAEADLITTVMLMPFVLEDVNRLALRDYLQYMYASSSDNKMIALYGLAMLGEPVLFDLQRYKMLEDLTVRDAAYIALGFAALGELQAARDIFTDRIASYIQRIAPYYRVDIGATRAEILDATSVVALLAAKIGMPEAAGLYGYISRHRFDALSRFDGDALMLTIERLAIIAYEIENHTATTASITYSLFGETVTRELGDGGQFNLRIPAQNIHEFNLVSVTGAVGAVSIARMPLDEMETIEGDINIRREFFIAGTNTRTNTFEQGDLVRVQITVDYSARTLSGSYVITDFLPAGLAHVANSARFGDMERTPGQWIHAKTDGQRITFYDFNGRFNRVYRYYYYARVISPGTFTAEGTMVQSLGAWQYMVVGEGSVLTVAP